MNVIRPKQAFSTAAALILLSVATSALAQFVWLDEKGVKQYSDMPPPPSVPNQRILKTPGRSLQQDTRSQDPDSAVDNKPDANAAPTIAEQNAAFQKRRADQAEKNKKAEQEAKQASDKANNCAHARDNQRLLDSGVRISRVNANGQREFIDDSQRTQQAEDNNRILSDCQ